MTEINVSTYRMCSNCVMDTSDPQIHFDANGVCDHCREFYEHVQPRWHTGESGRRTLEQIVREIKSAGKNRDFDCILGMSGGMDSSYMLHMAVKEFGLRPLVFHVDGGWNSELAVHNINSMIDKLGLDLFTEVINWEEMRDFQLAFFKSGVPHIDIPQDHAFVATLYNFATQHGIRHILNGGNIATECVRYPLEYYYYGTDMYQIRDIQSKFGTIPMNTYPFSSVFRHKIYLRYVRRVKVVKALNYIPYTKAMAAKTLEAEYGWRPYPQKHFESRFTRFFEGYWLVKRFGFDVRRVQFSSLVLTNQMTREAALRKLEEPPYDADLVRQDVVFIATKLGITPEALEGYLTMPKKYYWDYRNQRAIIQKGAEIMRWLGLGRAGAR
jgi:N-acetyl sugar amidotransferase